MNIEYKKITLQEYNEQYKLAEWFSPIQNEDFSNAIRCDIDNNIVCVFNYTIDSETIILSLSIWQKPNFSFVLGELLKKVFEMEKCGDNAVIYLIDKEDVKYLENTYCKFKLLGKQKKHLKIEGQYYDLYTFMAKINNKGRKRNA